jgi:SUMO ligase MMS21 Smc5/6 complex component
MSRYLKHKTKKTLYLLAIVIFLIIISFTLGFQIIIKGSVFIANLFNKSKTNEIQTTQVLSDIQINEIPESTNSSKIKISGIVSSVDNIIIFLSNQEEKRINVNKSNFETYIDNLKDGENKIYFVGESSKSKVRIKTEIYLVYLISEKPKIEISEPQDNSLTQRNEIKISGKTNPNVDLKINNLPAVVSNNGEFSQYIKLNEGKNEIIIKVTDLAGSTEEKKLTVTYEK